VFWIRILPSTSKEMKKNLDFYRFVPSKRKEHENIKKKYFLLAA
jgi:hypothetical protein